MMVIEMSARTCDCYVSSVDPCQLMSNLVVAKALFDAILAYNVAFEWKLNVNKVVAKDGRSMLRIGAGDRMRMTRNTQSISTV